MKSVLKKRLAVNIKQFDGELTFEQVKTFLEANKDNDEVKAFYKSSVLTADNVKAFLDTSEGKKMLQPKLDAHFTKGLETWKTNNLETLVDEEVKKRNPAKTPEQIELEKLRSEIENERKARNREALVNKALKVADEKKLPKGIIDFFIADDEENTLANLTKFEEEYGKAVQSAVDAKFKEHGRVIDHGNSGDAGGVIDISAIASDVSLRK